jgi:integrase
MAIEKVGIYRKWLEPVPKMDGKPIPKSQWPRRRRHSWIVRWYDTNNKRYGKVFITRKEAQRHALELQSRVSQGRADKPSKITLHEFIREHGKWSSTSEVVNNLARDFDVIHRRAGIGKCTLHDLRRAAITNWAQELPIQVVQQLAGHSDISTTRKYYLAVRAEDLASATKLLDNMLARRCDN